MEITSLELNIIELIYQRDYDDKFDSNISTTDFDLTESNISDKTSEVGFYLMRLYELNYIEFNNKAAAIGTGGSNCDKYNNNIIRINWSYVKLTYKGRKYVEEQRKTFMEKIKEAVKRFTNDTIHEIRTKVISHIATFITGAFVMYLYLKLMNGGN